MKKAIILLLLFSVALCGCGGTVDYRSETFFCFGTSVKLIVVHPPARYDALKEEAEALLSQIENAVSLEAEDSDLSRYNALASSETTEISPITAQLMQKALEAYRLTGGAFNPAVYRLVDLWGFSTRIYGVNGFTPALPYDRVPADRFYPLPDEKYIRAFLALTDFTQAELSEENGRYYLKKNAPAVTVDGIEYEQQLDFGGIAKGYAADEIKKILDAYGVTEGYLNIGTSSILLLSGADGEPWNLTIRHPRKDGDYLGVKTENRSVSTSGDYQRYYEADRRYCHVINPFTGRPVQSDVVSASVFTDDGCFADALSTACMVLGSERAIELLDGLQCDYALVVNEQEMRLLTDLTDYTTLLSL